jgi:hypothetical protein
MWDIIGTEFGVTSKHYTDANHKSPWGNVYLNQAELNSADSMVIKAKETLHRPTDSSYINLLRRNGFQAKNADAIFAVSSF